VSELRRDREWEHWPQDRRPDERIRRRLRGLFHPTVGDDDIERALSLQSNEIELRAHELAQTVADLERREARTHELRSAVEQMLRRGSAELDERHAELSDLAARLADRETAVADAEEALAERRRELGAVELRRAAVERREEAFAVREEELARREDELGERESVISELEGRARELETREHELTRRTSELELLQARVAETLAVVEREQQALAQREASVQERERLSAELERREHELTASASELRTLEESLAGDRVAIEEQREELRQAVESVSRGLGTPGAPVAAETSPDYVALVPGGRYRLVERDDGPPSLGARILVEEEAFRIVRLGSSPLPDDRRRCAFLEQEHGSDLPG
jgi:DNA repair exonuclease SbcCD ATPase subunit